MALFIYEEIQMSTTGPDTLDIQLFRGIVFKLSFQVNVVNTSGVVTGPYDLTGSELMLTLNDILNDDISLSSEDVDLLGSYIKIDNAALGQYSMRLTAVDLATINKKVGDWRIERKLVSDTTGVDKTLLVYGTARVVPFSEEGAL
jgi:hypothetical protein